MHAWLNLVIAHAMAMCQHAHAHLELCTLPSSQLPVHAYMHGRACGSLLVHGTAHAPNLVMLARCNMQGVATMVLESPFYGRRAPAVQKGSRLQHVSDLLTLGRSTIEESLSLLNWASLQGFTKLGGSAHVAISWPQFHCVLALNPWRVTAQQCWWGIHVRHETCVKALHVMGLGAAVMPQLLRKHGM